MTPSLQTNEIDRAVGAKLSLYRLRRRISQAALADLLGVDAETVQGFETGAIRLGASVLVMAAMVLGTVPSDMLP